MVPCRETLVYCGLLHWNRRRHLGEKHLQKWKADMIETPELASHWKYKWSDLWHECCYTSVYKKTFFTLFTECLWFVPKGLNLHNEKSYLLLGYTKCFIYNVCCKIFIQVGKISIFVCVQVRLRKEVLRTPWVRPHWDSNSWPPDRNSTSHVTETPVLTSLAISDFQPFKCTQQMIVIELLYMCVKILLHFHFRYMFIIWYIAV